jgi:hypothetical protein
MAELQQGRRVAPIGRAAEQGFRGGWIAFDPMALKVKDAEGGFGFTVAGIGSPAKQCRGGIVVARHALAGDVKLGELGLGDR